jgi:hypothetical protein
MPGYRVGPNLKVGERPFRDGWEQDPQTRDGHEHEWETVLLAPPRVEECVRCAICLAPRCGHSGDEDPCMDVRHHRGPHLLISGGIKADA